MNSNTNDRLRMANGSQGLKQKVAFFIASFLLPLFSIAQTDAITKPAVDMATAMRSNGKIYVVVAVLSIILIGIFLYLVRLDRKISKLEKFEA